MNRTGEMSYTETSTYQAVDLPYGNAAFSMTVILPKAGQDVNAVAKALGSSSWQTLTSTLHPANVNLALPKLKLEYERVLTNDLKALGMKAPFIDGLADFSKMTPAQVFISFVKQNSFVDINEEGTEAAAVTTIGVQLTSAPQSVTMRVDRPYIFVIRERLSGTVLFMGKILRIPG
jgi:serine protease inhibitor